MLKVGANDQITFKDWYATTPSKPVAKLQMIAEAMAFAAGGADPLKDQKVENFNFAGLVGAFDAARMANPSLTSWLTNALTSFQLAGSDTAAIGGNLAYQYGKNGTLAGIGVTPALATISDTNLGTVAPERAALQPRCGVLRAGVCAARCQPDGRVPPDPESFNSQVHRRIFAACLALHPSRRPSISSPCRGSWSAATRWT